ncbi:MAG TPA: glycosyl transferase, partial [bacterium]|nr:glycosyl transferase [bacterium]
MTTRRLIWIVGGGLVARAALAASFPVLPDEAYYWVWAHHLDWGYPDHPPMIAYLIAMTTLVWNGSFWVRLSPLVLGAATSYTLFLLGREMFD